MRPVIDDVVDTLPVPPDEVMEEARAGPPTPERHAEFVARIAALHRIEARPPGRALEWPGRLRVAAFNAERLKQPAAVRSLLEGARAHAALLSEADVGMARSGNVHTVRALAEAGAAGYVFGAEYVELDLGDEAEMREHAGRANAAGLHGNALVTGLALVDPVMIPLEEGGLWFPGRKGAQRRIGTRMAVAARVASAPRPLVIVAVHLESKSDPRDRGRQMAALLRALDRFAPGEACIIGGDFNTKALPRDGDALRDAILRPERDEPLFAELSAAGFAWTQANPALPTQRAGPTGKHAPPFAKLDWLVARGAEPVAAQVVPALDGKGRAISDHEMLVAEFVL